jgi:hypothetical protein
MKTEQHVIFPTATLRAYLSEDRTICDIYNGLAGDRHEGAVKFNGSYFCLKMYNV